MKMRTLFVIAALLSGVAVLYLFNGPADIQTEFKVSGAKKALDRWSLERVYPFGELPKAGYFSAFQYSKNSMSRELDSQNGATWRAIGPHNIGGRTLTLAFNPQNPNTIYAGSASGGLWKSYSAGRGVKAWEQVTTGFPVLGVSSIVFAPIDSNTILIGTGEVYSHRNTGTGFFFRPTRGTYGIGILKSTDGGTTWTKSLDWTTNQERGVWVLKLNPQNPRTIWAGTTEGTFRSLDAGETWVQIDSRIMVTDLIVNPADTNIVMIATGNLGTAGHGIYRTANSGASWSKVTAGLPPTYGGMAKLTVCPSSPNVVYASIGNGTSSASGATWLAKSVNSGATFQTVSTTDYSRWQGWFAHDVGVHPNDPNAVIAVGVDIWKSIDGGTTLTQKSEWSTWFFGRTIPGEPEGPANYSHGDHRGIFYHPENPDIVYFATDGGIFRSLDAGETFEGCNGGYQTAQFYQGFASSQNDSALAIGGMQDNSSAIYDGQLAWIRAIGGDGGWAAISPLNDDIMYGSAQVLNIFRSLDRGQNWLNIAPPAGGITSFIAPYAVAPNSGSILYAGRTVIFKSTDNGSNWTGTNAGLGLDGNPALAMAISHQSSNVVYVTTAPFAQRGGVHVTRNGGATWTNITGSLPDRFPVDVAVDPTDDRTVFVTFSGFGTSHVFKSENGGGSWQDIGQSLPDVPTSAVIIDLDFPDNVYIGNDLGVYVSTDAGNQWQTFQTGLPEVILAMDLSISPGNRTLRVATHGSGAFERKLVNGAITSVTDDPQLITEFRLRQNYPNPFNPSTTIAYQLPKSRHVRLRIYNTLGQQVRTLVDHVEPAGQRSVIWDGKDDFGQTVSSGVYLYQMSAGGSRQSRRMLFTK
jgi:photosystem II stability/assembly factor-like uncharacterized protein